MNKLSLFVAIATLSLAAPALAQTPSDIRNGRGTVPAESSPEVKLDRQGGSSMQGSDAMETSKGTSEHHGKKHHHKHAGAKHHGKKHHHSKKHHEDADKGAAKEDKGDK